MKHDLDMFGRRLERHIKRERISSEPLGAETANEQMVEVAQSFDGTIETVEALDVRILDCRHPHRVGDYMAQCGVCSEKARRPIYVCKRCAVVCPVTGQALCLRCTKLGPDGRRYSPDGLKQAVKMGLFATPPSAPSATLGLGPTTAPNGPVYAPAHRPGLLARLLEWW